MKRCAFAMLLFLGVLASSASAANLSVKGNVNETLEASDNYFLSHAPLGTTYKSLTALNVDALARTPTTSYLLDTNFSYYNYFGPGAAETTLTSGTPMSAKFTINHTTELTKYNLAASWQRVDLASTLLTQTGTASATGSSDTYTVSGGFNHDLSRIDSISLQTQAKTASFTESSQTPYLDVSPTLAWKHGLTRTTNMTNSVLFDWFKADDAADSQRLFWQFKSAVKSELSKRLTFSGSLGEVFVNAYREGAVQTALPSAGSFQLQPGATNDWTADADLTYKLLKTTTVSVTAAKLTAPTELGQLQKLSKVGVTLKHDINHYSNIAFSADFANTNLAGTISDFFSAQVRYDYKLAREWRISLSYTYRQRNELTGATSTLVSTAMGPVRSNTVLFRLTHDFTALGNPKAFDEAEKERQRERKQESIGQVFPRLR